MGSGSWLHIPLGSHFSLANIPFGIVTTSAFTEKHAAIAIGDHVMDLHEFTVRGGFSGLEELTAAHLAVFFQSTLNDFAAAGQPFHQKIRKYLQKVLAFDTSFPEVLKNNPETQKAVLFRRDGVNVHLPMKIGGYTDFFAGKNHAYNCGCIFRDPTKALQPNYVHLPVGYNSRASSVIPSGTAIRRPLGQFLENPTATQSTFGPCQRLDIELELGALLCKGNKLGEPVDVNEAEKYIFGFVLLNDWSARDIQSWEAMPLGPFNAKTFASTISPWVVLKDALEPFRSPGIPNEVTLHRYLQEARQDNMYQIDLEVQLRTSIGETAIVSHTNSRNLIFSFAQMIAHHTIGGCPLEVGDLLGSGTISGTESGTLGSLLEASWGGKRHIQLSGNVRRKFLEDGDTVTISGWSGKDPASLIGFGDCVGTIEPAIKVSE